MLPGITPSLIRRQPLSVVALGDANATASTGSIAVSTSVDILAGDTVVVAVGYGAVNVGSVSSVSDGTNTYTLIADTDVGGDGSTINGWMSMFYAYNCAAVTNPTITATLSANRQDRFIAACRIAGATLTDPLDASDAANTGSDTTPSIATGTLVRAYQAIIGFLWANGNPTITEDGDFTNLALATTSNNNKTGNLAYYIVNSTSSVSYDPTRSGSTPAGNLIGVASIRGA